MENKSIINILIYELSKVSYILMKISTIKMTIRVEGCCSVSKLCLTLQLHGLQHAIFFCPSLFSRVCSNSCPLSQ